MTPATAATSVPEKTANALAGAFTMPVISPIIWPPPPYRFRDCRLVNILFTTDPAAMARLVPAPLEPDLTQPVVLYVGRFQFADFDLPYNEAGLFVPVVRDGKPAGLFAVALYLDTANPIVGGREIYGWPKKDAERITFDEEDGRITAEVTRYGSRIISVSLELQQRIDPIPPARLQRPTLPIYLLKLIPSVQEGAPPDVLQLNSIVIEPDVIKEMRLGKGTLEFGASPFDPFLAEIPVKEVVHAEAVVRDFTLGYGQVVFDYLASAPNRTERS
jgi:acetoacetate decarboxylase